MRTIYEFTPQEIEKIIVAHLSLQGKPVQKIDFQIENEYTDRGEMNSTPRLKGIKIITEDIAYHENNFR